MRRDHGNAGSGDAGTDLGIPAGREQETEDGNAGRESQRGAAGESVYEDNYPQLTRNSWLGGFFIIAFVKKVKKEVNINRKR